MRKIYLFLLLSFLWMPFCRAQWTTQSFVYNNTNRQYRLYLPAGYITAQHYPLVMTLHGLGDNMNNFSNIGMNLVADTAKFIVLVPQALVDATTGAPAWNSGAGALGIYPNANVDDVGFLNALIDTLQNNYSINKNRIYSCGFSMGGYMTQRLGCQLTDKFAAIASMAGTMGSGLGACTPSRVIPVAHFHGTGDMVVPYTNNNSGIDADSLVRFWVLKNGCNPTPAMNTLPDIAIDGCTVDHYVYTGTNVQSVVELFKVNGANHIWLTRPLNDISYCVEAWRFFSRYERPGTTGIGQAALAAPVSIFPNPARDHVTLKLHGAAAQYRMLNLAGQLIQRGQVKGQEEISLEHLPGGVYFLNIITAGAAYTQKLVVEK